MGWNSPAYSRGAARKSIQLIGSCTFFTSVGNQNMRKYKVGDRLLGKLSGGRIVEATAKAVDDVVSGHVSCSQVFSRRQESDSSSKG